jgi:hypothetical protein
MYIIYNINRPVSLQMSSSNWKMKKMKKEMMMKKKKKKKKKKKRLRVFKVSDI